MAGLVQSVSYLSDCSTNKNFFMYNWIIIEAFLFLSNIFGVSAYLFTKKFLNMVYPEFKIEISQSFDAKCASLSDVLSRNVYDSLNFQWAINTFMVSIMCW